MSLIEQIYSATQSGKLSEPFTTEDMKDWIASAGIVKDDGNAYAEASIEAILSNSDVANSPTTNKNSKVLKSSINANGKKEYWF